MTNEVSIKDLIKHAARQMNEGRFPKKRNLIIMTKLFKYAYALGASEAFSGYLREKQKALEA